MTSLDPKGLQAAHAEYHKTLGGLADGQPMENAINAYLSASTTPSGEVEGLETYRPCLRPNGRVNDPGMTPDADGQWVRLSEASTALASMKREVEIAERNRDAGRKNFHTMQQSAAELMDRAQKAEARIQVLEEALKPFAAITEVPALGYVTKAMVLAASQALGRK